MWALSVCTSVPHSGCMHDVQIRAMSKDVFKQMDLDKNNRLSKAEYVRQHSGRAGEAAAVAAFEAMDISKNGAVSDCADQVSQG